MGNGSSTDAPQMPQAALQSLTLSLKLMAELPPGYIPAVVGDHVLGAWDPAKAVFMRPDDIFWRLHFFLPATLESFQFNFAVVNAESGVTVVEDGGRRCVSCGELVARAEAEGGICVRLSLPIGGAPPAGSDASSAEEGCLSPLVEGFPGCAATLEDMFDVAQEFMTGPVAAGRASYWGGGGGGGTSARSSVAAGKPPLSAPRLHVDVGPSRLGAPTPRARSPIPQPWQSPTPLSTRRMSENLRAELPLAVASFQDLVLIGRGVPPSPGSESDGDALGGLSRSASPAPRDADHTPVPQSGPPRSGPRAAQQPRDHASMAKHVSRALGIADDHDASEDGTPDAEAAANAAASVNAAMDQVGPALPSAARRAAAITPSGARSPRRGADRSPPRHLEMAVSASDGVVDASAVSFLAAPRGSSTPGSGATATDRRRLAIIMVGLPARGKSFTAHKLARYLTWLGHETRHFNVGKYRRDFVGRKCSAEFFDPGNDSAVASRNAVAKLAMEDMLAWMEQRGGQVGIFDATNSTRSRRQMLTDMCRGRCKVIFLETVCTDKALIRRNVQEKVTASPDYAGTDPEEALRDFMRRMDEYEKAYEPLGSGPDELPEAHSFIRVVDIASGSGSMQVSRIQGYLPGRIVYFLLNAQLAFRPIYLCRHGKSEDNMAEKIGGDSGLSPPGKEFAKRLRNFMEDLPADQRPSAVWTSTLRRTIQTARPLGASWPQVQWRALDEIDAGACEGLTYAEIKAAQPDEYAARMQDKLRYRYPRGESYLDLISRLEPVIIEIERQRSPVLIVAHQAVHRCLLAYFTSRRVEEVPHLNFPLHSIIRLTPSSYGVQEDWFQLLDEDGNEPTQPPRPAAGQAPSSFN